MSGDLDSLLPDASEFRKKLAQAESEEASRRAQQHAEAEAEKKALIDQLSAPSGVSDEEGIRRGIRIIERAVSNGLTEVQVHRFPNALCTDHGRAINQREEGWPQTLTGVPKEIYQLWDKYFRPRGYKLSVDVVDYPGGMPGDIAMTLKWV
jgi:hypothetical protein